MSVHNHPPYRPACNERIVNGKLQGACMRTMTLTEFLLARFAEDERDARKAEQGRWKLWGMSVMADPTGTSNVKDALPVAQVHTPSTAAGPLRTSNARHIARHDPARVLADCEAKRRIVELHPEMLEWCQGCAHEAYPCRTLKALAPPYADHPDYREEWKP